MRLKLVAAAGLAVSLAAVAHAQYTPPRAEVARLPDAAQYAPLEPSDVVIADCRGIATADRSARVHELAVVRVTKYAPWPVGVGKIARDKAGELGANCLEKRSEWGLGSYPLRVSYRVYRIDREVGFGSMAYVLPVPRAELAALAAAASPAPAPTAALTGTTEAPSAASSSDAGDKPLWTEGEFIFRFEIGMDTAKFSDAVWRDVVQDFKGTFPPAQYAVLLRAHARGERILVDFKNLRITEIR